MTGKELADLDAPACPFLGLVNDRPSHFSFPHPAHRCFARKKAAEIDAQRQQRYCVSWDFPRCDRFPSSAIAAPSSSREPPANPAERLESLVPTEENRTASAGIAIPADPGSIAIVVLRRGDSLAKVAARYGLTVEEIAAANELAVDAAVTPGTRLAIPLSQLPAFRPAGSNPAPTGGDPHG
jgi:LysM repeat protein